MVVPWIMRKDSPDLLSLFLHTASNKNCRCRRPGNKARGILGGGEGGEGEVGGWVGDTSQCSCSTACRRNLANTWQSSYLHDILHNRGPAGHLVLLLWPLLHFQPVLWGLHLLLHKGDVIMMSWDGGVLLMTDVL